VRYLSFNVNTELRARVERAAMTAGVKMPPWLRAMVRQGTIDDFSTSWQKVTPEERSHDYRTYGTRFMLRLNETSQTKLQQLIRHFGASKAVIIRQRFVHATPEDFRTSWQLRPVGCRGCQTPQALLGRDGVPDP
jgi:hypothetical protein